MSSIIAKNTPASRKMDCTPNGLAQRTNLATNTVRKRIDLLDIDFNIGNDSHYKMYNHECLPILEAYVSTENRSNQALDDTHAFIDRLVQKISSEPNTSFCKKYLLMQTGIQNEVLHHSLYNPIMVRLKCIEALAMRFAIAPTIQSSIPGVKVEYPTIVNWLDQIIWDTVSFLASADESSIPQEQIQDSPTDLARKWCTELIGMRNSLMVRSRIVLPDEQDDTTSALDNLLSSKYLSQDDCEKINHIYSLLGEIDKSNTHRTAQLNHEQILALRQKIDAVIDYNLESFLDNMLNTLTFDAKFEIPEACELNDRLLSAVEKWYTVSIDSSGTLLESMRFLLVLHQGFKGTEPNSYNDKIFQYIVNTAQNKIDDFRDVMLENGYLQSDLKSDKYFAEMLQYATTSKTHFNLDQFTLSYRITICDGTGSDGRKVRHRKLFTPDKNLPEKQAFKAAQKEAFLFEQQFEQGYSVDNDPYFRDYAKYVLQLKLSAGLKRSTYDRYVELLPRINECIGGLRLRAIRPMHLNQMYAKLSKPGVRGTGVKAVAIIHVVPLLQEKNLTRQQLAKLAKVSPSTVTAFCNQRPITKQNAEQIAAVLGMNYSQIFRTEKNMKPLSTKTVLEYHRPTHTILAQAEKEMLVPYNAADKSTPPKSEQPEVNYFQPEQIRDILAALESEPLKWQVMTHILMITGGRRGEVCGLEWSKIDFERKRLRFDSALLFSKEIGLYEGPTKTSNRRYVPLPDETLALLKELRVSQKEQRLLMGDRWQENDYIFKQDDGQPMRPDSITQWLRKFAERHGLPHINPHAFRHTAASVMIVQGTDIVTISKMLGHAKVSTTEDIYSHVIEDSKQQAGNVLAQVYYGEKRQKQA